jgi:hypothetical protein
MLKRPGFTLIAVMTLALGIGANTAIFTVVNAVLLRPLPYPSSEKLMELGRVFPGTREVTSLSEAKFMFLRDHLSSFEAVTATQGLGSNTYLSDANETEYIHGLVVSSDFFRVLGVARQRTGFTKEEDSPAGGRGHSGRRIVAASPDQTLDYRQDHRLNGTPITSSGFCLTVLNISASGCTGPM